MKKSKFILPLFVGIMFSACGTKPAVVIQEIDRTTDAMNECNRSIQKFKSSLSAEDFFLAKNQVENLQFNCDYTSCKDAMVVKDARNQKTKIDSARVHFSTILEEYGKQVRTTVLDIHDQLTNEGVTATPFYANKNDFFSINITTPDGADVSIYNADSHAKLRQYKSVQSVNDSLLIPNDAIYLVEVKTQTAQYISYEIDKKVGDIANLGVNRKIKTDTIPATEDDFRAIPALQIKAESVFEEPRKITLKSIGGSLFGGNSKSVVALNVPDGTLDVAYQLRISTNKQDQTKDGQFCKEVTKMTSSVKIFGVTVKEKEATSTNLLREALNRMVPPEREEDAFCSMYVVNDDENAKLAQNGSKYEYNIDYSTVGTQSCNGRIRNQKNKPIYLCFTNDRFSTTVYIWLEAIATYPYMAYYKEQYSLL